MTLSRDTPIGSGNGNRFSPLVSIVTVCLNAASTIDATVQSVLSQTYPAIEYVVVDGASTDDTLERLHSYGAAITKLISEPDTGLYNAMNKALGLVQGDAVVFMNAGDIFASSMVVEQVVSVFTENPATMLVYGDWQAKFPDRVLPVRQPQKLTKWSLWLKAVCHQSIFARRSVFERIGGFDESLRICADWDWTIRAVLIGRNRAVHVPLDICVFAVGGICSDRVEMDREKAVMRRRYYSSPERKLFTLGELFFKMWRRLRHRDLSLPWAIRRLRTEQS